MDSRLPPKISTRRWIRARRAAVVLWLVFGFVLWNVIFDANVAQGARDYLTRKILHEQGRGPAVTIHAIMDEAVSRGARTATVIGGSVSMVGLALVWLASRRRVSPTVPPGPSAGGAE